MAIHNSKEMKTNHHVDGVGIVDFFKGKELLITGATGFLGKVLVEKILREIPEVSKIYLLIRANNQEIALQRLKNEIINTELFKLLQQIYGDSYDAFMMSKLVPVAGNIRNFDFVLQKNLASHISNTLDVIINSSANTTWDERYDVSIETNINGPCNLLAFAKRCKQFKLFLHVSSVFANTKRVGKIMEKPFWLEDDNIARTMDVGHELQLVSSNNTSTKEMRELGRMRARQFGFWNVYEFTKAMGEIMINRTREDIPVVIIRPSSIECALNDPFPGWIEGRKTLTPIITNYGEGNLTGLVANPSCVMDIIPVDMVANAILAATAKHGSVTRELGQEIKVYHVGSSSANPIMSQDLFRMLYEHFKSHPAVDPVSAITVKVSPFKFFSSFQAFSDTVRGSQLLTPSLSNENPSTKLEIVNSNKLINRLERMAMLYMPFLFDHRRFDSSNMEKLMEGLSIEEREKFNIAVKNINWEHYIKNVLIPGVKMHFMKKVKIESML